MRRSKRLMAFLMSVMMVVTLVCNGQLSGGYRVYAEEEVASDTDAISEDTGDSGAVIEEVANFDNSTYVGDNYEVTLTLDSYWDSGYNATITIKNTGDTVIENWCMAFPLEQNISNIWNASIEEVHEDYFVIKNAGWNQDIAVDGSVSFGITCYEAFSVYPEYYTLLGNEVELASGDYSVAYEITEDWGEGYKALVTITNNKSVALEDWRIKFNYGDNVITQIWDAVIISQNEGEYYLSCQPYNQNIEAGKSISFGFLVEPGTSDGKIEEIVISEYNVGATSEEIPDNDKDDDSDDTSGEGTGDDTGDIPDKEDEKSEEVNLEDAFVGLLGEVNEDNKEIELYIFSNIECEKYEIYVSYDGLEYMLYDTTEESTYYYSQEFTYVKFYVIGCYSEDMYIESPWLSVSNRGESYSIYMEDTDSDFVEDSYEFYYGSDINVIDSDFDGFGDYYEIYDLFTNPASVDTDGNGILDVDEDFDGDGLTAMQECINHTDVWNPDTDTDFLTDYEEVNIYFTDPCVADTDKDGRNDGDEIVLGTDPLVRDTDGDGFYDSGEYSQQNYVYIVEDEACAIDEISVDVFCRECFQNKTTVESVMNKDYHSTRVVGLFGEPFEIKTKAKFDTATLSFKVDKDMLGDIPFENLMFLWYDEAGKQFVELETTHDEENGIVSTETTHFSKYMLVDSEEWYRAWSTVIDYDGAEGTNCINTILCIDCSESMKYADSIYMNNDVNSADEAKYRKTCGRINGANTYINMMSKDDNTAIIFFNDKVVSYCGFTSDKEELKLFMQELEDSGNTNFDVALKKSLELFTEEMINDPNTCNRVVFLSDGSGDYVEETLQLFVDKEIQIFGVGVGKGSSDVTLKKFAEATGGLYYKASDGKYLSSIYEKIYVQKTFEVTDYDNDGLYDEVESMGIRLIDGTIIYTKTGDDDSDDDGLLDGEEIDTTPILYIKVGFNENGESGVDVRGYMFRMNSDPNNPDTDGDGIRDDEDNRPKDKGIYSNKTGQVVVGELSIISASGHSFLIYKSYIDDYFYVENLNGGYEILQTEDGQWTYVEENSDWKYACEDEHITFGSTSVSFESDWEQNLGWPFEGDTLDDGDETGIYYNREVVYELNRYNKSLKTGTEYEEKYKNSAIYSRDITKEQQDRFLYKLAQLNYYNLATNNCANVAIKTWNYTFEFEQFGYHLTPIGLRSEIRDMINSKDGQLLKIWGVIK